MKLSMWMIANCLRDFELDVSISKNAAIHLKSARRAYATDCVHVFRQGGDVVCNGDGDIIILRNTDVNEAFELIQSVFDFYEDMNAQVEEAIDEGDFQKVVDSCWHGFRNPLTLIDANMKVLGISSQYGENDLDGEWRHLHRHGYSSVAGVSFLREKGREYNFFTNQSVQFCRFHSGIISRNCYTSAIYYQNVLCGRTTLLEHERQLNPGDAQLLSWLVSRLAPALGSRRIDSHNHLDIFVDLVKDREVDPGDIIAYIKYYGWEPNDGFLLYVFTAKSETPTRDELLLLRSIISKRISACTVSSFDNHIIIVVNTKKTVPDVFRQLIEPIMEENTLFAGVSLPMDSILDLKYFYDQAVAAIKYGRLYGSSSRSFYFYDYALDYLLENGDGDAALHACHPDVAALWSEDKRNGSENISTLSCYLKNERSLSATSKELFVHKNTLSYRIKKIENRLNCSLNDEYSRDYIKQSIRLLHLDRIKRRK